ncbi:MAG TPA: Ig-like domain-containing protein [Acidimicrobiales bacterium]|nr:Ig-like domain-containing protein [Acidimicrobiales bacterium]
MAKHFGRPRHFVPIATGTVVVAALGAGGAAIALRPQPAASAASGSSGGSTTLAPATTTTTAPRLPLQVSALTPAAGATGVSGASTVVLATNSPVDTASGLPTISPAVAGRWNASGDRLVFTPTDAFAPSTTYTVTVPAGLRSTAGSPAGAAHSWSFTTQAGSTLRLQQLLAQLGYLPLNWSPSPGQPAESLARSVFQPPTGQFSWTWTSPPATLTAAWSQGQYTVMTKGAVMAFEADHGLTTDGVAGPHVWAALLAATSSASPPKNQHGYTYALATKALPETLRVWHDGTLISTSRANTGIPQAPTADGTFPVYERLATQVMKGKNPDGSKYADPVAWVAYFNGGDAIHYIARAAYGSPQSLGCVEIPYAVGQHIWPSLTIGTLVTVAG